MGLFKKFKEKIFEVIMGNSLDVVLGEFKVVEEDELFDLFGGKIWGCTTAAGEPCWKCILGDPTKCA